MSPKTYQIITYGCQMNASDSEMMAGILEARGLRPAKTKDEADLLLVNTCIVRGSAEQRALGHIAGLKSSKDGDAHRILGICGCMAQRDADALFDRFPHVDLVLGTRAIPALSALLDRVLSGERRVACVEECDLSPEAAPVRRNPLRALVPIMIGCDNWCSYCIVPAVRGSEKCRPAGTILEEIQALVESGCREVTLVGQNVNSYRDGNADFANLLERVNGVEELWRIRYITSHPRDAGLRHIEAVAALDKVCDHFHLPAQSGSTAVLERMNRGYTRENYLRLIEQVRARLPEAAITTDLIVGFPGETEEDYEQTLRLAEEVRFDAAFTFLYNPREGTRAAQWEDNVPLETKKGRLARLIALQERISLEKNQALAGKTREILVEGPARRSAAQKGRGQFMGRTTGDKCVVFDGVPADVGTLKRVRIIEGASHTLWGKADDRPE